MIKVKELMEKEFFWISPERSVKSAGELMSKNNTSYLLVMDGEKICGIVTSVDLCSHHPNRIIEDVTVRDVISVSEDDSIGDALVLMQDKGVKQLPVVDEKENVTGIIDENTILSYLASAKHLSEILSIAASVAHELNNSLGAISGYAEILQDEEDISETAKAYIARIETRVEAIAQIVTGLKDFAGESTHTDLDLKPTDVNQVLQEALELTEGRMAHQNIEVIKELEKHLPQITADASGLQQVFLNIILNAKDAMPDGGTLTIRSGITADEQYIQLSFVDTGVGIRKEHISRVFEPFFTTREVGKGTVLGLSISHGIIQEHSGYIDVVGGEGRGSVFRIILPTEKAKNCWEIVNCSEKDRCIVYKKKEGHRCWKFSEETYCQIAGHGPEGCEKCEVYLSKAVAPLDESYYTANKERESNRGAEKEGH